MNVVVMSPTDAVNVLNRLLAIVYRSLPMFLHDAQPWHSQRDERANQVLGLIIDEQWKLSQRIAQAVLDRGAQPEPGDYPLEFSDANWHFVGLDFLLWPLVEHQRVDVERIARCVGELQHDRAAKALAEEALGAAKAHLESLEELL